MKEELLDNLDNKRNIVRYIIQSIIILIFISLFSLYIWVLFWGDNSERVLTNIKIQKEYLEKRILSLQENNANLQKEYFELKNLEPE